MAGVRCSAAGLARGMAILEDLDRAKAGGKAKDCNVGCILDAPDVRMIRVRTSPDTKDPGDASESRRRDLRPLKIF